MKVWSDYIPVTTARFSLTYVVNTDLKPQPFRFPLLCCAGQSEREADLRAAILSLSLTALQCVLFSVCAATPFLPLQYLTFILQVLNRSFLYGGNAAFISLAWVFFSSSFNHHLIIIYSRSRRSRPGGRSVVCAAQIYPPQFPERYHIFMIKIYRLCSRFELFGVNVFSRFPPAHFGKLYGAVMALSAVFSLLQYPCFALIKGPLGGDPLYVRSQHYPRTHVLIMHWSTTLHG